jgi:hypothetical protein
MCVTEVGWVYVTGLIWLGIELSGVLLWARKLILGFSENSWDFLTSKELLVSRERFFLAVPFGCHLSAEMHGQTSCKVTILIVLTWTRRLFLNVAMNCGLK